MRTRALVLGAVLLLSLPVAAHSLTDILYWGFQGVTRARTWVGPDGRMSQQSLLHSAPSAWDIWPTLGAMPLEHAISELTVHRRLWSDPCTERLSLAAMTEAISTGQYRVSIETGVACGTEPKGLLVCFDDPAPGAPANCRLWVRHDGVYTSDDGVTWRRL